MAPREIEAKILEVAPGAIHERLTQLGAEMHFDGEMRALFFDFPDGRLRQAGDVLRIRQEGKETVLAYKKKLSKDGLKIMEEYESPVQHLEMLQKVFEGIGMCVCAETHKHRSEYLLNGAKIVIDRYLGKLSAIPPFIEIEAHSEQEVYDLAALLGFQPGDCLSWDTRDLVRHYIGRESEA